MNNNIQYKSIACTTALNRLKRGIPYRWDMNIYRGCEHGCKYCYAQYTHSYMGNDNFFTDIYIKENILEQLERQLSSETWQKEVINIGGVTDSYQPAEATYKLMPEILKLLIKYRTPAIISTKSNLILRDYDLIDELSRLTYINVAATITTVDESLRQVLEPNGAPSKARFEMLKAFKRTNASIGLHVMPIIPYLTDSKENIEGLFAHAKACEVDYVLPGVLYLRGATRRTFFEFIDRYFHSDYETMMDLYQTGGAGKEYKDELYKMINRLRKQYGLESSYMKPMRQRLAQVQIDYKQLSLFD